LRLATSWRGTKDPVQTGGFSLGVPEGNDEAILFWIATKLSDVRDVIVYPKGKPIEYDVSGR